MKEYMLIAKNKKPSCSFRDSQDRETFMKRFQDWENELKQRSQFVQSSQLSTRYKRLEQRSDAIEVTDGPYSETKEAVTGYFLIEASNLDTATAIARECPALLHGETVEITELGT